MERQGTIRVIVVPDGERLSLEEVTVTTIPLPAENAYAFLFEDGHQRILVAMDETHGWEPAGLGRLDLALIPIGVFEHHPFSGERLIPEEFCVPPVKKTRYPQALEMLAALSPRRAVLSHVEEMDRLSHDELRELGAADGWEPAYDGMVIDL
jgi:phosphoribosyl 1,2-cyclic phosphate phosphodiesterase